MCNIIGNMEERRKELGSSTAFPCHSCNNLSQIPLPWKGFSPCWFLIFHPKDAVCLSGAAVLHPPLKELMSSCFSVPGAGNKTVPVTNINTHRDVRSRQWWKTLPNDVDSWVRLERSDEQKADESVFSDEGHRKIRVLVRKKKQL